MEEQFFYEVLKKSWSRDSSSYPDLWSKEHPSIGQCIVSAALAKNFLGYGYKVYIAEDEDAIDTHYVNIRPDNTEIKNDQCSLHWRWCTKKFRK